MTTETMTITKALSELKILNKRIRDEITSATFCDANKRVMRMLKGKSLKANASTTITVGGDQLSIAEAIYMKNEGIDNLKTLLTTMSIQYTRAQDLIQRGNGDNLTRACEDYIVKLFGSGENKNSIEGIEAERAKYIEDNTIDLIEGVDTAKAIETLKNKIDTFEAEVDAAITVANATTTIEISY